MLLTFLRHPETDHNVKGLMQGQTDGELSDTGYRQLESIIPHLKTLGFSQLFASDAKRTSQAAELISKALGLSANYSALLREIDRGLFAGLDPRKVDWSKATGDSFISMKPPGGESIEMGSQRWKRFLGEQIEPIRNSENKILIVSHGGFIKIAIADLLDYDLEKAIKRLRIDNCGMTTFELNSDYADGVRMLSYNSFYLL